MHLYLSKLYLKHYWFHFFPATVYIDYITKKASWTTSRSPTTLLHRSHPSSSWILQLHLASQCFNQIGIRNWKYSKTSN